MAKLSTDGNFIWVNAWNEHKTTRPYSVGFDSTVNRIASFAEDLKTTGRTHNRILVMEVFGRYAGHTAFRSGVAAETDAILIPEIPDTVFN